MLRFSLGVARMDLIRKENIRERVHVRWFREVSARLRWFERVQRLDSEYISRRIMRWPERRFMDVVKQDKKLVGVREEDAEDRVRWRQMIRCGNS